MRTAPISTQVATRPADGKVTSVTFSESPQRSYLGGRYWEEWSCMQSLEHIQAQAQLMDVLEKSKLKSKDLFVQSEVLRAFR
jgi:hypothetical protein